LRVWHWLLLATGGVLLGGGNFLFPYLSARDHLLVWVLVISLPLSVLIVHAARQKMDWRLGLGATLAGCFLVPLVTEWAAESWWPNSADEYGYTFLAQTLLHGRLWNPPPPMPLIFDFSWVFVKNHKWFSQYPPAWSALLAPFLALGAGWLLNPLLNLLLGILSWRVLRVSKVPEGVALPALFLLMFAPFTIFNGASLFAHTFTGVLIMGIVLLQSHDENAPGLLCKIGIGAVFGVLMLTRYEVFVLTASCYVLDRLYYRRLNFPREAAAMGLGGAPFIIVFLLYDRAVTGRFFKTPYSWASSGAHIGLWGKHVIFWNAFGEAVLRTLHWFGEFFQFASPLLIVLAGAAVAAKFRARNLRFTDIMLPVAVIFFFFYPQTGGHEFGPRYWFFAWPGAVLGIATGLAAGGADLRLGRRLLSAPSLAALHAPLYAGVLIGVAAFTHVYVNARRTVYDASPPQKPALVLIPSRNLMLTPLQTEPLLAHSSDFTRNGVDVTGDIIYGRADQVFKYRTPFTLLACEVAGRHLYLWREPGELVPVVCKGA
jgi:hypothetical protein